MRLPVWIALALLAVATRAGAAEPIITKLVPGEPFLYSAAQTDRLIDNFRHAGFNTATVIVGWSAVEPEPRRYDFSRYRPMLDKLAAADFKLLLILDSSGREFLDPNGAKAESGDAAIPDWIIDRYPDSFAVDFFGGGGANLDFADDRHRPEVERFYRRAVEHFRSRYGDRVLAYIPGVMHELEIKYAQQGYRWQGYSEPARAAFRRQMNAAGIADAEMPTIAYANQTAAGFPTYQPLFPALMEFRERVLVDYVCRLTAIIRAAGGQSGAYFGQSLSAHDAIYALGAIERFVDCFDKITVDYNYYDGWRTERNPHVLPLLVSYARNLGYPEVLAGLYFERLYRADGVLPDDSLAVARDTVRLLAAERPAGVEIGNILQKDFDKLAELDLTRLRQPPPVAPARYRIGVVASRWTFYLWMGEHGNDRNIIQDALTDAYRLLAADADVDVEVLGDRALLTQDLGRYDALFLPYQTTLSDAAERALLDYHAAGGRLAQDVRFGAFGADGAPTYSWHSDTFGIAGVDWQNRDRRFIYRGQRIDLPAQPRASFGYALLTPTAVSAPRLAAFDRPQVGLTLRAERALTFGFLPQTLDDRDKSGFWRRLFVDELKALIDDRG